MAEVYSLLVTPWKGLGQQNSLAFKATWTKKQLAENRADFDRVKGLFFTLPLININQNIFIDFSLRPSIIMPTCGKWASDDPFKIKFRPN